MSSVEHSRFKEVHIAWIGKKVNYGDAECASLSYKKPSAFMKNNEKTNLNERIFNGSWEGCGIDL